MAEVYLVNETLQSLDGANFIIHFTKTRGIYGKDAEDFEVHLNGFGWAVKDIEDELEK